MNKEKEEFVFDIEEPTKAFTKHLNVSFNERIILSAPFGSGKTYFLDKYFKNKEKEFEAIHLFPINYSVASNKDIFELIKYDILFELFGKNVEFDKVNFNELDFLPFYLENNEKTIVKTLAPLLSVIPQVGKALTGFVDRFVDFCEEFEKQYEKVQVDDKKAAQKYLELFGEEIGGIYEDNFYSQLIRQLVEQLHGGYDDKPEKETVLIIDDLDRIDPEHVFRILNVLSAHLDRDSTENKFGFDRIILVFDEYNVRNIFKNRYGTNVDYTGYIDKFYTYKIFKFYNPEGMKTELRRLLNTIEFRDRPFDFSIDNKLINSTVYVFHNLIESNQLTPRRLLKVLNSKLIYKNTSFEIRGVSQKLKERQFHILFVIRLLLFIYEDWGKMVESLEKMTIPNYTENSNLRVLTYQIIDQCILLLDVKQHNFEKGREYIFESPVDGRRIKYSFEYDFKIGEYYVETQSTNGDEELFNQIFQYTVKKVRKDNIIRLN